MQHEPSPLWDDLLAFSAARSSFFALLTSFLRLLYSSGPSSGSFLLTVEATPWLLKVLRIRLTCSSFLALFSSSVFLSMMAGVSSSLVSSVSIISRISSSLYLSFKFSSSDSLPLSCFSSAPASASASASSSSSTSSAAFRFSIFRESSSNLLWAAAFSLIFSAARSRSH